MIICQKGHLGAKLRSVECLSGIVENVGCGVERGGRRSVDGEIVEIRVVQIVQIHRQIHGGISPTTGLMMVIQAKHDGKS